MCVRERKRKEREREREGEREGGGRRERERSLEHVSYAEAALLQGVRVCGWVDG